MSYEDLSASRKQLPPLGESRLQATADRRRDSDGLVGAALGVAGVLPVVANESIVEEQKNWEHVEVQPNSRTPYSADPSTEEGTLSRSAEETPDPALDEQRVHTLRTQNSNSLTNTSSDPPRIPKTSQRLQVHQSVYFPNVPLAPVNGMIKTYGTDHRTFTRPHSAKTVFFYKDNDIYYTGLRVPISKARYRTIDSLLDRLNENITLPFGVRHLHTPHGRTPIKSIDQLQHLGK